MSGPVRIQLRRVKGWRKPADAVVVTRSSKLWGNPFKIGDPVPEPWNLTAQYEGRVVEDRQMAVDLFESYSKITPFYVDMVRRELAGKDLACWCPLVDADGKPVPCHADVLLEIANSEDQS
jgi:hypothetical protein